MPMFFSCSRAKLEHALSLLHEVVPSRSSKPILQNVHIQGQDDSSILLSATDLEIGVRYRLEVDDLREPEGVLLPCSRFFGLVRDDWSETIAVHIENNRAEIQSQNGTFQLAGSPDAEFPPIGVLGEKDFVVISGQDVVDAIQKTLFATARSDTRFALNGILLGIDKTTVDFVASDTHRLSLVKKKVKNKGGVKSEAIIITKGMTTISKLASGQEEVRMRLTGHELIAETNAGTVVTRLVDGQFPRYRDVIPKDLGKRITVGKELLAKALRLGGQLTNEDTRSVSLAAGGDRLLVSITGSEVGEGKIEIDAHIEGGDCAAAFNYLYIVDVLRVLDDNEVTLQLQDSEHPARIDVGDFTHVIMPIRARG